MNDFSPNSYRYVNESSNDMSKLYNDNVIRQDIITLYKILVSETNINNAHFYNQHIMDLYNEWLISFKNNNTNVDTKSTCVRFLEDHYLIDFKEVDFYKFLFTVQTYFCIIDKLLVVNLLKQINDYKVIDKISWSELSSLFLNCDQYFKNYSDGLFDVDYYVWFVSVEISHTTIVNQIAENILRKIHLLDIDSKLFYSTSFKEQLVHLYSFLMPVGKLGGCKTIKGEDFNYVLDHEICLALSENNKLNLESAKKISSNVIGFSSDKISLLICKCSYMVALIYRTSLKEPLMFKIYPNVSNSFKKIDSRHNLKVLETSVGNFIIPLSGSFYTDINFFRKMSIYLECKKGFSVFWDDVYKSFVHLRMYKDEINRLYESLMLLRTPIQYDFWSVYIRSKFTPLGYK